MVPAILSGFTPQSRQRTLFRLGSAVMTVAFILLRAINVYGDPSRCRSGAGKPSVMTVMSFLNCTKQPASLDFLLMILGPAAILLAIFDSHRDSGVKSRTHLWTCTPVLFPWVISFLIHLFEVIAAWFRYGVTPFLFVPPPSVEGPRQLFPPGFGYDLWVTYAVWAVVVLAMYPACRWYSGIKARRRDWWLSYL